MKTGWMLLLAGLLLAGCATSGRLSSDERLALYRANAGEPVSDFQFFGRLNGWTELGDSALAVWTRPGEAWLLELNGRCPDLEYAPAIGLTSLMGRVSAPFDKVLVHGAPGARSWPCPIKTIRKLDVKALKDSEQQLRDARTQERETP